MEENFSEKDLKWAAAEIKQNQVANAINSMSGTITGRIPPKPPRFQEPRIKHRGRKAIEAKQRKRRKRESWEDFVARQITDGLYESGAATEYIHHPNKKKRVGDYNITTTKRGSYKSVHAELIKKYLDELEK